MRGGVTGLAQGYCLVSPPLPALSPALLTSPCPSHCSRCPAKFIYPIIVLSRHVSSSVSTPLLCLASACHHTETLPPAITTVKRSDTLDKQMLSGVPIKVLFSSIQFMYSFYSYHTAAQCVLSVA